MAAKMIHFAHSEVAKEIDVSRSSLRTIVENYLIPYKKQKVHGLTEAQKEIPTASCLHC
jgi:hypothetical protein